MATKKSDQKNGTEAKHPIVIRFAAAVRAQREKRKLTQEELAARAGISISYVSMLERGNRTPPLDTVGAVAKALNVKPAVLLG